MWFYSLLCHIPKAMGDRTQADMVQRGWSVPIISSPKGLLLESLI